MNPAVVSTTLLLLIGAVNGDGTIVTVEQSITPSFSNGDGIEVNCGDHCQVTDDDKWFLSARKSDDIEDWAIEVDLSGAFALSSGLSSISFTIDGERVNGEADMFMGFGDGEKYISFSTDFDGQMSSGYYSGVIVYPPCGSPLADGSVSDILSNSQQYASNAGIAVRHALADGDRSEWRQFGGERHNNGNSWPVTIEIVNDEDEDTVTLRFISENSGDDDLSEGSVECVYTGTFTDDQFTFGMLPDLGNGNKDDFHIDSIDIEVASTVADDDVLCDPADPLCGLSVIKGDWVYDMSDGSLTNTNADHGNIVWFGSRDGLTPDPNFEHNSFTLTATIEVVSGYQAGLLFRTGESSTTNDEGPTYYLSLNAYAKYVRFFKLDNGHFTLAHETGLDIEIGAAYTLSVHAKDTIYNVYLDGVALPTMTDLEVTDLRSGSIGLRTHDTVAKFHSLSYSFSDGSTTSEWIIGPDAVTLLDAEAYCVGIGGHLASIHSAEEHEAAIEFCRGSHACWIGLNRFGEVTDDSIHGWQWFDGSALDYGFDESGTGNPCCRNTWPWYDGVTADCVVMMVIPDDGAWDDRQCVDRFRPLCSVDVSTDMSAGVAAASVSHGTASGDGASSTEWSDSSVVMIAAGICIGLIVVSVLIVLKVMMKQKERKEDVKAIEAMHVPDASVVPKSVSSESVAEMSEVVDAPKVVHVADDTVEVTTETAVNKSETTTNGMEEAVEVKVQNTETV